MANYVSKHTGAQIDAAVENVGVLDGKVTTLSEEIADGFGDPLEMTGRFITAEMVGGSKINVEATAGRIVHTGKNLFEVGTSIDDYRQSNSFKAVNVNGQQVTLNVAAYSEARVVRDTPIPVKAGDSFAVSFICDSHSVNVAQGIIVMLDAAGNALTSGCSGATYVGAYGYFSMHTAGDATFTINNENAAFILPGFRLQSNKGIADGEAVTMRVQYESGSVTKWEAGTRNEITVNNNSATAYAVDGVNHVYALDGSDVTAKWKNANMVKTINGYTGNVTLTATDVGAMPIDYTPPNNIITRNADVLPLVKAAARYGYNGYGSYNSAKQLAMLATTDIHHDTMRYMNALSYMDEIPQIDFGICLGDMMGEYFSDNDGGWFVDKVNTASKKMYVVIGNHESGNTASTATSATKQQQFNKFFAPVLTKLGLGGLTKTYYSVNTDYGVTMIVLDCHDLPDTMLDDTTFAVSRKVIGYSQAQVDWLVSTLFNVPAENHVIVAVHNTLDPATMVEGPWTQSGHMNSDHGSDTGDYPDMIPEIIDAWQNGKALSKTYTPKTNSAQPTLTVSADFTSRGAGVFAGYLRGHTHRDYIAKMTTFPTQNIYCLAATAHDKWQNYSSDLPRVTDEKTEDCITVVAVDKVSRKVKLVRIGSNITFDMVRRDMIAIPY